MASTAMDYVAHFQIKEWSSLHGAKRALFCGKEVWVSPAMMDLIDAAGLESETELRKILKAIDVVPVASLKSGKWAAFK